MNAIDIMRLMSFAIAQASFLFCSITSSYQYWKVCSVRIMLDLGLLKRGGQVRLGLGLRQETPANAPMPSRVYASAFLLTHLKV